MRKTMRQWCPELGMKPFWMVIAALELKNKHWNVKTRIVRSTAEALRNYFFKKHPALRNCV